MTTGFCVIDILYSGIVSIDFIGSMGHMNIKVSENHYITSDGRFQYFFWKVMMRIRLMETTRIFIMHSRSDHELFAKV